MSTLMMQMRCQLCSSIFEVSPTHYTQLGWANLPKSCPTRKDKKNGHGKVVQDRRIIAYFPKVRLDHLPILFKENTRTIKEGEEKSVLHAHYDGSDVGGFAKSGGSKSGSLTLYTHTHYKQGDIVSWRHMIVTNQITQENSRQSVRTYEYVFLGEPEEDAPLLVLNSEHCHRKTTLRGLGRNRYRQFQLPAETAWQMEFSVGFRSGRAHNGETWYIAPENCLAIITTEDD